MATKHVKFINKLYLNNKSSMVLATGNSLAKQLLELISDRLHGVLVYGLAVRASEMTHQDDRLGTVVERVLNGRQRGDDTDTSSSLFHTTELVF